MTQYLDYTTDDLVLWFGWLVLAVVLAYQATDCNQYTEGTDMYHECVSGEPLDLTLMEGN